MNKDIEKIVSWYREHGEVSDLRYRGKLRYYGHTTEATLDHLIMIGFEPRKLRSNELLPAWSFILTRDGKRYRFVIARDDDGDWLVFPGKSFCNYDYHDFNNNKDYNEKVALEAVKYAFYLNHFTPHPTCKVVKDVRA